MAINRYSNLSTSKFDPLSLQEVMMVPLYKQQQYDKLEADRVATEAALKIDPLDVHTERATKLKQDFDNKVTALAKYQAQTGDIQGAKSKLLDLHREYKRLTDPMGEVSKINSANKAYQDEKNRFLEAASKQYGSTRALELWNQNKKKYTGYDDAGKIINISPQGIVAAKDFDKELQQYHNLLGSTATAAANSGYRIADSGQGDGSKVMINSSGQIVKDSNIDQINSMRKAMAADWISPTGEGYRYNQEAGVDPIAFQNKFNNLMDAQLKTRFENKTDVNANYIAPPSNTTGTLTNDGLNTSSSPYTTHTITGTEEGNKFDKIGKAVKADITGAAPGFSSSGPSFKYAENAGSIFKYTDLPVAQQAIYKNKYDQLIREGKIKEKFKDPNNRYTAAYVTSEIKKNPVTLSDRRIEANVTTNNLGFPSDVNIADAKSKDASIMRGLVAKSRSILDPETNQPVTLNQFAKKYAKDGKVSNLEVQFNSQLSPYNWQDSGFKGNAAIAPDIISYTDSEGNVKTTTVSKEQSYLESNNGKADAYLNKIYRKISLPNSGFQDIDLPNMKGTQIKYIPEQDAVIIKDKGREIPMSVDDFSRRIYSMKH